MARNPRYDILFEPVRIGPVTARNRFYAVPHASGMTNTMPRMRAAFRGIKAEGGWGVVCTGYVSIASELRTMRRCRYATLWDENDVRSHALMTDAVHKHGALAGIELWHGGGSVMNRRQPLPPLSPSGRVVDGDARRLHGQSALANHGSGRHRQSPALAGGSRPQGKARRLRHRLCLCGYGLPAVRVPAVRNGTSARMRTAAASPNRVRIVRELLEVTKDAVRGKCAVALRISLEELRARPSERAPSEAHEVVELLAEVPDLWDVKLDSEPDRLRAVAVYAGRQSRAGHRVRQALDDQAGRRRRALHLARHHGRRRSGAACSI